MTKKSTPKYAFKTIEKKWQKKWEQEKLYQPNMSTAKKPFYNLMMFPYPSAEGMHVGSMYTFSGVDTFGRFKKMQGYDVFEPIGLDGFGIHAENFAMKIGQHIKDVSKRTEKNYYRQLKEIGNMHDWSRTVETYKPEYYKWTQWLFLQMYKKGLAYQKEAKVNWCPSCKTVLSDEQVISGECERCESIVEKKNLKQWFFAITKYADQLLKNLKWIDWPNDVKLNQKNWIGKSEGAIIEFGIMNHESQIKCFTTRPDTLFGATYLVIAPEHEIITNPKLRITNQNEVEKYVTASLSKSEEERKATEKSKTGVELKGIKAINPATKKEIPIWVADYVLSDYGTGAIMAVPAHDERDFEFAKKFDLLIKQTVTPDHNSYKKTIKTLSALKKIHEAAEKRKLKFWLLGGLATPFYSKAIYREHDDIDLMVKDGPNHKKLVTLLQDLGFRKTEEKKISKKITNPIYKRKGIEVEIVSKQEEFGLREKDFEKETKKIANFEARVLSLSFLKSIKKNQLKNRNKDKDKIDLEYLNGKVFVDDGIAVNSGFLDGMKTQEAKKEITKWLTKTKNGKKSVDFKLRDWCISRQRYWGPPIPIVWCKNCALKQKKVKVLMVHGLSVGGSSNWFPWMKKELEKMGCEVLTPTMPKSDKPNLKQWIKKLKKHTSTIDKNSIIISHSLGSRAVAHFLEQSENKIGKWISVSGALGDHMKKLSEKENKNKEFKKFVSKKINWKKIDQKIGAVQFIVSKEDKWIDAEYCKKIKLSNQTNTIWNGHSHFTKKRYPRLKNCIIETILKDIDPVAVPVPEKDLPVKLPPMDDFLPEGKGKGPLAKNAKFVNTKCPVCDEKAQRETDVSDPFVDSAWYFFRYPSTEFNDVAFDKKRTKKWLPVDSYIGGKEHTVLHLLYSRFVTMVLKDLGYIDFDEPYKRFFGHGLITKDGAKMSKSKGNVVNPDEMIKKYGADTVRLYLRFVGDFSQGGDWRDTGIEGMAKFVARTWKLFHELPATGKGIKDTSIIDKTIKVVGEDLEKLSFNTAIARIMEFVNWIKNNKKNFNQTQTKKVKETLTLLIAPMAPHIAEEFWSSFAKASENKSSKKYSDSIFNQPWPKFDPKNIIDETFELVIQVNGKVRDKVVVSTNITEQEAIALALESNQIQKWLADKKPKKMIYVKGKLISIVI